MIALLATIAIQQTWQPVEISVYSKRYHGRRTASGERYDHYKGFTGATTYRNGRWTMPKGSVWEIEYQGRRVTVRINDTGSHRPRKAPVWIDLNGNAWTKLTGIAPSRKVAQMRRIK